MTLEVHQFPCLNDNYGYLIHEPVAGVTATIDTPEVGPINAALADRGWRLTHILNTHHHFDHAGGNDALKAEWGATVVGADNDAARIPGIDVRVADGRGDGLLVARCFRKGVSVGGYLRTMLRTR